MITADEAIQITINEIENRDVNKYIDMLDKLIKNAAKEGNLEIELTMPGEFDKIDILKLQQEYGKNGIRLGEIDSEDGQILRLEWFEKPEFKRGGGKYI
jgi:hypothetical protein